MTNLNLNTDKSALSPGDKEFENNIRPAAIEDFSGQPQLIENLLVFIKAAKMRGEALDESDPAITKLRDESEERTRAAQRELLGDADYGRLLDYERALPVRDFVDNLTSALVFMDAPLGGAQADRLTQVLADANEAYRQSGNAESLGPNLDAAIRANLPAREVVDSAKVLEQARPFLSPPQYERLEAELLRLRLVNQVWNVVRQTPGEPIIGFVFGRQGSPAADRRASRRVVGGIVAVTRGASSRSCPKRAGPRY